MNNFHKKSRLAMIGEVTISSLEDDNAISMTLHKCIKSKSGVAMCNF